MTTVFLDITQPPIGRMELEPGVVTPVQGLEGMTVRTAHAHIYANVRIHAGGGMICKVEALESGKEAPVSFQV